jgi:hypothetical protein
MNHPMPSHIFWSDPAVVRDLNNNPVTPVSHHGRKGWRTESLETRIAIPAPQLNEPRGSLTWWFLPREDFATSVNSPWMAKREKYHHLYTLLGDRVDDEARNDPRLHHFALIYSRDWYQQLQAKWHCGGVYDGVEELGGSSMFQTGKEKAYVGLGHLNLHRGHWIQVGLSWDEPANDYRMYLNGVLVQTATTTLDHPMLREKNSDTLYAGHPLFACGELAFYDRPLDAGEFAASYDAPKENAAIDASIARTHTGKSLSTFDWKLSMDWSERLNLPLNRDEDFARFYVQGMTEAPSVTPEGIRVRTSAIHKSQLKQPENWSSEEVWDPTQVYLWLEDYFTGDFAVEYEFKSLQKHGLSLLMTRAAGLHGEDFLKSHPRRVSGAMRAVCWENIRNYHWEYYRQMEDCRNDTASHVLVKNPYLHPIGYQDAPESLAIGEWHRLQFVHEGNRLRGAIDGVQMLDVVDDPFSGFGPVMRSGTLAIRCMWDSDILFRNLKVWTKPDAF